MSTAPLVSVLLPAHDAEATLAACLKSLARQTEPRFECVLVDDGSTDGTRRAAEEAAALDRRIRVLSIPHSGIVGALEAGIDRCTAPFVARVDADDLVHRDRFRLQLDALERDPTLAAVGGHVRFWPRRDMSDGLRAYERWLNAITTPEDVLRERFIECPVAHPTLMLRREVLQRFRYRDAGWPEDYDLVLRMLTAGERLAVVPRRVQLWRDGPTRLTRVSPIYRLDRHTACKAAFLAESFLAGSEEYVLWGYGQTGRALAKALRAHGKRPSHIVEVHPRRVGNTIGGAPVIRPEGLGALAGRPLVVSVAGAEARSLIRGFLAGIGWREIAHFVCAA